MPMIGTKITCSETGRVGAFIARSAHGGFVCRDRNGYFHVAKSLRGVRKLANPLKIRKPSKPSVKREWQPTTSWTTGGPINPELLALAARVKGRKA